MKNLQSQAQPGNDETTPFCFVDEDEAHAAIQDSLRRMRLVRTEHRMAAINGMEALPRLVAVMRHGTGQGYKLRKLLFSLWSGTPGADLSDVNGLDWELRRDLCRVLLGWGYEDATVKFFYNAMEAELRRVGLMDWFREEGGDK